MATYDKYRQKQKNDTSTLLTKALAESKNNKLEPTQGSTAVRAVGYFDVLKEEVENERQQTKRLQKERSENMSLARAKIMRHSNALAQGELNAGAAAAVAASTTTTADMLGAQQQPGYDDDDDDEEGEEDMPDSDLSKIPHDKPSVEGHDLEVVYREALRAIINRVGAPSLGQTMDSVQMYAFLQKAFRVNDATHSAFLSKELSSEKPKYNLQVTVVAGEDLEAKDENGLSDPFCILGVVKLDEEQRSHRAGGKKTKSVTELTDNTHRTEVKLKTLTPDWDETFNFPVDDLSNVFLQVDLWDQDEDDGVGDALKRGGNVKGVKGFGRFLHNVGEAVFSGVKDDFMGRCFVSLADIPQGGVDKHYPLESKRNKSVKGQLRLKLQFIRDQDESAKSLDPEWPARRVYERLYWDFVRHDISELQQRGIYRWRGRLPQEAEVFLHLFRVQQGISNAQHVAREWHVLAEAQQMHGVKFARLIQTLDMLAKAYHEAETKGERMDEAELRDLATSMERFVSTTLELLGKQRDIFPPNKTVRGGGVPAARRLSNLLVSLAGVYKFKGFSHFFPSRNLHDDITQTVRQSTEKWFEQVEALAAPAVWTTVATLKQLTEVVRQVKTDLVDAGDYYENHFQDLGVSYYAIVFKELDRLVHLRVTQKLEWLCRDAAQWQAQSEEGQQIGAASFQLFVAVQGVHNYCSELDQTDARESEIRNFHDWFEPFVGVWLSVAEVKALEMVKKAVELDKAAGATDELKYGTSAVDVTNVIHQLCDHFLSLQWPQAEKRFHYMVITYASALSVMRAFALDIADKLVEVGYYDVIGQFDISVELTTTLNGFDHGKVIVEALPERLHWAEHSRGAAQDSTSSPEEVRDMLMMRHDEDVLKTRRRIVEQIGKRMSPDIKSKTRQFIKKSGSILLLEEGLESLMVYLMENLKMLMKELVPSTFMDILEEIYRVSIKIFYDAVVEGEEGQTEPPTRAKYRMIQAGLEAMLDFFECDGHGLTQEQLSTPDYLVAAGHISMFCADSNELSRSYYSDLVKLQETDLKSFGSVTVALAYEKSGGVLHAEVLHAKDLPPMDLNDCSDPYFAMELRPVLEGDGKAVQKKTTVKKKTLMPLYDEKFVFQLPANEQCQPGAVLRLICYDWDRMTRDDVIGESFIPVHDLPIIESPSDFTSWSRSFTVPVLRIASGSGKAYQILEHRKRYDKQIATFVGERESFFNTLKSDEKLGTS